MLDSLNPQQLEAIKHLDNPLLILAGAGSGKTKTLTTRLAYLIQEIGIPPESILCLTFTNKAAQEMRERAMALVQGRNQKSPLLVTFHKFGLLFLKLYIHYLSRKNDFVLLDSEDVKKILKDFKSPIAPATIASCLSGFKNAMIAPEEALVSAKDTYHKAIAQIYWDYELYLRQYNLLDFDDLLLLPYRIMQAHPHVTEENSQRYKYIMVDEYQDTNALQYRLLKQLCTSHSNVCVVGDEDQSIYGWRGADIHNILNFERDFGCAKVVKLEQNYRSTPQILEFANALIAHNSERLGKTLMAIKPDGEKVEVVQFENDKEEIAFIVQNIERLRLEGISYPQIAILYRLNALSRNVEDGLRRAKIPYRLVGAVRFYERAEIKDILSYLRLMLNPNDDFSLLRVINRPKRGIGKTTQEKLIALSKASQCSVFALSYEVLCEEIGQKNAKNIQEFFALIEELKLVFEEQGISHFVRVFESKIDLAQEWSKNDEVDRKANIDEFFAFFKQYYINEPSASLQDFLNELSLSSDTQEKHMEEVLCMSVHTSKGAEFECVFLIGFEDGFFPLIREDWDLQEERRLGYVAFTRAKTKLFVTSVQERFYRGKLESLSPSRFLKEIANRAKEADIPLCTEMKVGGNVKHKVFGIGRVLEILESGKECKVRVNFGGNQRVIMQEFLEIL